MEQKLALCLTVVLCIFHAAFGFSRTGDGRYETKEQFLLDHNSMSVRMIAEQVWQMEIEEFDVNAPSIPELVKSLGLTTLLDLVVKAGLAPTLSGEGPFTVFGPTNDAFGKLPEWAKKAVKNVTVLADILKYHVLPVSFPSSSLKDEQSVATVLGKKLRINIYANPANADTVVTAQCASIDLKRVDQKASNGLIHVLNSVMIPPYGNIVETAVACPVFKTLVTALKAASLVDVLSGDSPFTVFAPTDKAFKKLPPGTLDNLLKNVTALKNVLEYHVAPLTYCSPGLATGFYPQITTVNKQNITVNLSGGGVKINNAKVIGADGSVSNGVIHAIDTVLLPPGMTW